MQCAIDKIVIDEQPFKLFDSIRRMHNTMSKTANKLLYELNLTDSQAKVLTYLFINQDCPVYQIDIEKAFGLTNPTVTGILKRLESKGFIKRVKSPNDSRFKENILTEKSMSIYENIISKKTEMYSKLTEGLTKDDFEHASRIISILEKNINNIEIEGENL